MPLWASSRSLASSTGSAPAGAVTSPAPIPARPSARSSSSSADSASMRSVSNSAHDRRTPCERLYMDQLDLAAEIGILLQRVRDSPPTLPHAVSLADHLRACEADAALDLLCAYCCLEDDSDLRREDAPLARIIAERFGVQGPDDPRIHHQIRTQRTPGQPSNGASTSRHSSAGWSSMSTAIPA